jgi:hypothetical protein
MARRVEEIKRVRRDITSNDQGRAAADRLNDQDSYEEEYYDVGENIGEDTGLNTASGVLALLLLALAVYLIWAALT